MTEATRNALAAEWHSNELELEQLLTSAAPANSAGRVEKERALLRRQDEIEYELGDATLPNSRRP